MCHRMLTIVARVISDVVFESSMVSTDKCLCVVEAVVCPQIRMHCPRQGHSWRVCSRYDIVESQWDNLRKRYLPRIGLIMTMVLEHESKTKEAPYKLMDGYGRAAST